MSESKSRQYRPNDWWDTAIIDIAPGEIRFRGYAIQDLIGNIGFVQMIWLLLRGELPSRAQADLLEVALMSGVDHGPQAPSIAVARMAITCGVGINNAMASAINTLGDVHGGAGEQSVLLFQKIATAVDGGQDLESAVEQELAAYVAAHGKFIPGYGHRFHPIDPRAPRLMELVRVAADEGTIAGRFRDIGMAVEAALSDESRHKRVPMNIDGATAVIYAELGFPAPLARGLFCLSRAVGILAHAWEQQQQGGRNKGPIPRDELPTYSGPPPRPFPELT